LKHDEIQLRIRRFDPKTDLKPHYDNFTIPTRLRMTVLEALFYVLEKQDGSLAFRYSCRSAVCGSCAMFINGRQRLACKSQISTLGRNITIGPLPHLPIIRDLVVDLNPFFHKIDMIKPYFEAQEPLPIREILQSPKDREAIDVTVDCIDCGACYSACPLTWTNINYPGPAALLKAARFIRDTRDSTINERLALIALEDGIWRCHTVFNCGDACPKSLNPTKYIQYLKRRATTNPRTRPS